jgi:uncharacterized SAM-binding protein YcdF (DUF218 family)
VCLAGDPHLSAEGLHMFVSLKILLRTLVLPPAAPLLLAAVGVWLLLRRRASRAAVRVGWVLVIGGLASLWLLATPVIAEQLTRLAEGYPALDLGRPTQAQAVVIISGGEPRAWAPEFGGPAASDQLLERLEYGAYVARQTGLPVLVSGTAEDAAAMQAVLWRDFSIRARWVDGESRDTFDNARFSARLLQPDGVRRIILVTSSVHEWRATREFAGVGLTVEPAPVHVWAPHAHKVLDYLPDAGALQGSVDALHELLGEPMRRLLAVTHVRRHDP